MSKFSRRDLLRAGLMSVSGFAIGSAAGRITAAPLSSSAPLTFHHDHVLGTSLDLHFSAPNETVAHVAESSILDEIERLRRIFSLFDPDSELSRLNRTTGPVAVSEDMLSVLQTYTTWHVRTSGANDPQVAQFVRLWAAAEQEKRLPSAEELDNIRKQVTLPAWNLDIANRTVTRTGLPLNLNCVVKGYVLDQARQLIRRSLPEVTAGLIDLGGDLCAWGDDGPALRGWLVGVQNPRTPADNASPYAVVRLQDASIATSGGYLRKHLIDGESYSHIIDPRTGMPADKVSGTTVIAADSVSANVLATTLCVLEPAAGLKLLAETPSAAGVVFPASGEALRSSRFAAYEQAARVEVLTNSSENAAGESWPEDFQATISLELPNSGGRSRRPYLAAWIEDTDAKPVRTLVVWGNAARWLPELSGWWKIGRNDKELVRAVTRATRGPGKYDIVWDGKGDSGKPLPQGTYTVRIEAHREHGQHLYQSGKLACGAEETQLTLEKNGELGATTIAYAKKK